MIVQHHSPAGCEAFRRISSSWLAAEGEKQSKKEIVHDGSSESSEADLGFIFGDEVRLWPLGTCFWWTMHNIIRIQPG